MKERKQKTLGKRLLVAMLSVMMTVTFIPTSLFAYAAEPEVAPDDVQNDVQTEVVQDDVQQEDVQEEVKTEEPQTEATKPAKQEATKAKDESKSDKADADNPEYTKDLDEVFVRVTTDEDAFAEKVKLVVEPLEEESDAFKDAEKALAKSKQTYSGILAYDIHFESVETGKEIEPDGTVSVEMQAKAEGLKNIAVDDFNAASVQMSHIVGKKAEVVADTYDKKQTGIEGTVEVDKTKKAVKAIDVAFEVESFSTFTLTWKNGENDESATIHFIELNEDGSFNELDPAVSLDTSAATVSLSTDFPDVAGKEYRFVGGYYSDEAVTEPADDAVNVGATLKKTANGWQCEPVDGSDAITIKNGSHIYASYKQFTKAGSTPEEGDASLIKPDSIKNVTDNNDGTYTVRLDINGHQFEEKQGANVLLIFDRTSSMVSNNMGNKTRFQAAKDATKVLVNALDPATNPIKISVMSFARLADDNTEVDPDYVAWTRNGTAITDFTDGLTAAPSGSTQGKGGTNWEAAFVKAKTLINALPEADKANPTYVVFLTDGNPTIYVGSNTIRNATSTSAEYTRARTEASGLNSSIPIYGVLCANANDGPLLNTLMNDLKSSDYGSHETHYVLANDETTLTNTFHTIATTIVASLGANQASTNDGVTALSTTSATAGAAGAFKYYKTVRPAGMEDTQIIPHNQLVPWDGAPAASYSASTGVTWDLESVGVLEDNTSYTLEFTVWPSQAAYDLIADLNNGLKVYEEGHSNSITAAERAQVYESGGKYYLKTNTNFDTTYNFDNTTYTDDGITQTTGNMVLPTETIDIEKIWNNLLDQANPPDKAVLVLTKDGANYLAGDDAIIVSANSDPAKNWKAEVFISLGQILQNNTDKTYQVLETGHDYEIIEPPELNKYQWELHSEIFRPMVINGAVVMLIKDNNASGTDGVDYYTIGGNKYKKDTGSNSLKAWNDRRSWLQLEKKVQDSTPAAPADTLFEYTITINNSNASQGKESDTASDFYVWFSAFDGSSAVKDLEVSSNVHAETDTSGGKNGYFYVKSGEQFTVKIKKGWTFRVLNLPSGSTYNIKETSIPDGFALVEATDRQKVDTEAQQAAPARPTINGATVDGTINVPNVEFYVDYTNKYEETDITIAKVWEVATGQQSVMSPDAFKSCLTLLANGTATTAYNDNLTITDVTPEGQTNKRYSVKYDKLPKYKNGQLVEYKVKESTIPEGYELTGSDTASDGGTITNTAKTGDLKITKKMGEDDDYGQIPDGLKIVVTGPNGFKETLTGTMLKQGNGSYTFEDVALGEYTATEPAETADIDGYLRDTTFSPEGGKVTVSADDTATAEIIVTNTYTSNTTKLKVKKNWIDANNQDGLRPTTLIVKILADSVELVEKQVTLSAENNWEAEVDGLAIYGAGGQKIVYTLVEVLDDATAAAYTAVGGEEITATEELDEDGKLKNYKGEFTNQHDAEKTTVKVTKVWDDADDQDGVRPESIDMQLSADGTAKGDPVTLNEDNEWTYTWENLDVNAAGEAIEYTVDETEVPDGYTEDDPVITGNAKDGFEVTITNKHDVEKTTVKVTKVWNDDKYQNIGDDVDSEYETPPVDMQLYADGTAKGEAVTLNEDNEWTYTWTNLDVNAGGEAIEYTVDELEVPDGFTKEDPVITGNAKDGFEVEITNTPKETKTVEGEAELTIFKVDGETDGEVGLAGAVFTLTDEEGNTETYTTGKDGKVTITFPGYETAEDVDVAKTSTYTLKETAAPGGYELDDDNEYTVTVTENLVSVKLKQSVWEWLYNLVVGVNADFDDETNTLTVKDPPKTTTVEVTKVWDDADDQDGVRPESIDYTLTGKAGGEEVYTDTQTVTETTDYGYTWEELAAYYDGAAIEYSVTEAKVDEYETTVGDITGDAENGFKVEVTNKHEPYKTTVTVTKEWADDKYADLDSEISKYERPEIDVQLYADGTAKGDPVTLNEENEWTHTWDELDVNKAGTAIEYTVDEPEVPDGFSKDVGEITGDAESGYEVTITNTPDELKRVNGEAELTIHKIDESTEDDLEGAVFTLTDEEGNTETYTTGEDGKVTITFPGYETAEDVDVAKTSTYTLKETTAPIAHEASEIEYTVTVTEDLVSVELKQSVWEWLYNLIVGADPDFDAETGTLTVTNPPIGYEVKLTKAIDGIEDLPDDFVIKVDYTDKDGGKHTGVEFTKDDAEIVDGVYTWTIKDVRYNTDVTAVESGYKVKGYKVISTVIAEPTDAEGEAAEGTTGTLKVPANNTAHIDFTNTYTYTDLEITKAVDAFMDAGDGGEEVYPSFAFRVQGYDKDNKEILNTVIGIDFTGFPEDDQTRTLRKLPADVVKVVVTEIGYGNYTPVEPSSVTLTEDDLIEDSAYKSHFEVSFSNTMTDDPPPSGGVVNSYERNGDSYEHSTGDLQVE